MHAVLGRHAMPLQEVIVADPLPLRCRLGFHAMEAVLPGKNGTPWHECRRCPRVLGTKLPVSSGFTHPGRKLTLDMFAPKRLAKNAHKAADD